MDNKLHILIVARWYAPSKNPRAFRTTELVREFGNRGHQVDIFLPIGCKKFKYENIVYHNIPMFKEKSVYEAGQSEMHTNLLKRGLMIIKKILRYLIGDSPRNLLYGVYLIKYLYKISDKNKYDMVLAISYPFYVLLAVSVFRFFYKEKSIFVADCGDPFYYNPANSKAFYLKYLEKFVLHQFDYIVVPTFSAILAYQNYNLSNRIKIIPQGVKIININETLYKPCRIPTFCYAGVFYEKIRNPEYFFQYLCNIPSDFQFVVYGLPDFFTMKILKKYKEILKNKLVIRKPIEREKLIYEMSKMDFVINFDNDNSSQVPSKLIDYAMSKRPILSFNEKTFRADIFSNFLKGIYDDRFQVDLQKYDIKNVVNSFLSLVEKNK